MTVTETLNLLSPDGLVSTSFVNKSFSFLIYLELYHESTSTENLKGLQSPN